MRALGWVAGAAAVAGVGLLAVAGWAVLGGESGERDAPAITAAPGVESLVPGAEPGIDTEPEAGAGAGIADLVHPPWVAEMSALHGIPERALAAYAGAEIVLQRENPACGLDWTTLAGIGFVESHHGTLQGGAIGEDGVQVPAVYGIALDGTVTDRIPDTDGGELDGDAAWDRAMGPMQIIPETWSRFGADGNADGARDPQQIDDAALSAARYLCADGFDLTTPDGWIAAVAAYNDTVDYNHLVADATSRYRAG